MSRLMRLRNTEVVVIPEEPIQVVTQQEGKSGKGVATLELKNDSASIARFTVTLTWTSYVPQGDWIKISDVEGDARHIDASALQASHYDSGTRTLTTYLGRYSEKLVNISFKIPKSATARAGRYQLQVTVEKKTNQGEVSENRVQTENINLFIQPFYDSVLSAEVVTPPQISRFFRRKKKYQVKISSNANDWSYFKIVHGGSPNFKTSCDQEVLAVPPGLSNGPQTRSFWISAEYKPAKKGHFFYGPDELNKEVPLSLNRIDAPSVLRFTPNYERELECKERYVSSKGFNQPQSLTFEQKAIMSFLPTIPMGTTALWQRLVSAARGMIGWGLMLFALTIGFSFAFERINNMADLKHTASRCPEGMQGYCLDPSSGGNVTIDISGNGVLGAKVVGLTKEGASIEFPSIVASPREGAKGVEVLRTQATGLRRFLTSANATAKFNIKSLLELNNLSSLELQSIRITRPVLGLTVLGELIPVTLQGPFFFGAPPEASLEFDASPSAIEWDEALDDVVITLTPKANNRFGNGGTVQIDGKVLSRSKVVWESKVIRLRISRSDVPGPGEFSVRVETKDNKVGGAKVRFGRQDVPVDPSEIDLNDQDLGQPQNNPNGSQGTPQEDGSQQSGAGGRNGESDEISLDNNGPKPSNSPSQIIPGANSLEEGIYTRFIDALMKGNERRAVQLMEGSKSSFKEPLLAFAYAAAGDLDSARNLLNGASASNNVQGLFYRIAEAMVLSTEGNDAREQAGRVIIESSNVKISSMPVGASWPYVARAYFYKDSQSQRTGALNRAAGAASNRAEKATIESLK